MAKTYSIRFLSRVFAHQHQLAQSTMTIELARYGKRHKKKKPYRLTYLEARRALSGHTKKWKQNPPLLPVLVIRCPKCRKETAQCFTDGWCVCVQCDYAGHALSEARGLA
jgi:hypothetical protein